MKRYQILLVLLLAAFTLASCNDQELEDAPVIEMQTPVDFEIPYTGGGFEIAFSVSNGTRPYVDPDKEWVRVVRSDASTAELVVDVNDGAARTATVRVKVPWYDDRPLVITVNQAAKPLLSEWLVVKAEEVTQEQFKAVVENRKGSALWYNCVAMTQEAFDREVAPDSAAWVAEYVKEKYDVWKYYYDSNFESTEPVESFADYYGLTNAGSFELLFNKEIKPATDYVIVAFDLDPQARYSGEISTCRFQTSLLPVVVIDLTFECDIILSEDPAKPYKLTLTPSKLDVQHFSFLMHQKEYEAALALYGSDPDKLVAATREQLLKEETLDSYIRTGKYETTFGDIKDEDEDGKVSLMVIASGMDAYKRINSKAQVSGPFVLDAPGTRSAATGYVPVSNQSRPTVKSQVERNWRTVVEVRKSTPESDM